VFSALPVDRAYIYFFDDRDEPKVHSSSGITRNFKPKPSYYALAHLQATLGAYHFARVLEQKSGDVYAYEFVSKAGKSDRIIVAWSPTGNGRTATTDLKLPEGNRIVRAQQMPLSEDLPAELPVPASTAVPLSESPIYLFVTATTR
jgi:serine/threonine-protein kinase ATR